MEQARTEAKARGEKLYEGRECIHGHGKTRYVSTGGCLECGRKSALDAYHKRRDRMLAVEPQVVTAIEVQERPTIFEVVLDVTGIQTYGE